MSDNKPLSLDEIYIDFEVITDYGDTDRDAKTKIYQVPLTEPVKQKLIHWANQRALKQALEIIGPDDNNNDGLDQLRTELRQSFTKAYKENE